MTIWLLFGVFGVLFGDLASWFLTRSTMRSMGARLDIQSQRIDTLQLALHTLVKDRDALYGIPENCEGRSCWTKYREKTAPRPTSQPKEKP